MEEKMSYEQFSDMTDAVAEDLERMAFALTKAANAFKEVDMSYPSVNELKDIRGGIDVLPDCEIKEHAMKMFQMLFATAKENLEKLNK